MKKVILYGIGSIELRRDAEYFIDNEYKIVGYSDTHYSHDSLDGAPFFPPQTLYVQPVDYIVLLSFQESVLDKMREYLHFIKSSEKYFQKFPVRFKFSTMQTLLQRDGNYLWI